MGYERYPRGTRPGDYYGAPDMDYGEDYGSGRSGSYSSARDYAASGQLGNRDGGRDQQGTYGQGRSGQGQYGQRDYGRSDYGRGNDYGARDEGSRSYGGRDYGFERYGQREQFNQGRDQYGARGYGNQGSPGWNRDDRGSSSSEYHGSYGSGGRRFEDYGRYSHADDDRYHDPDQRWENRGRGGQQGQQGYGRQPQGYDYADRGFLQRAGDEVRSWFGDEDAERRREMDSRFDDRYAGDRDDDYRSWRSGQVASFDRDYHEYRQENRSKFENEFSSWRTNRQTQRDSLDQVKEHMDVVGSDGQHVGTVDKVRGDRILLTKNDSDAGGRHHSIPSSWLKSVDDKVTLTKSADEAKRAWRDEESKSAMFGYGDRRGADQDRGSGYGSAGGSTAAAGSTTAGGASSGAQATDADGKVLNKSFSGTY